MALDYRPTVYREHALMTLSQRLAKHGLSPMTCFISYCWSETMKPFAAQLRDDLAKAGIEVIFDMTHNQGGTYITGGTGFVQQVSTADRVVVCCTPDLKARYGKREGVVSDELDLIIARLNQARERQARERGASSSEPNTYVGDIFPIWCEADLFEQAVPEGLRGPVCLNFSGKEKNGANRPYEVALWDLLKALYRTGQQPHLIPAFDLTWHEWESKQRSSSESLPDVRKTLTSLKKAADLKSIELEQPQLMSFYVPPDSVPHVGSEARVPLEEKLRTFLRSNETVLLLLGDAGMGKTVAGLKLVDALWERGGNTEGPSRKEGASEAPFIPLRIELKHFNEATAKDCVEGTLREQGLSQSAIEQLKQSQDHRLLVIFDGLDELAGGGLPALFMENGLSQWPRAKAIIGCRNEYLVNYPHYKSLLSAHTSRNSLIECQLAPLTEAQIEDYIDSRVKLEADHPDKLPLPKRDYVELLKKDASLKALIQNPFLLKIYARARSAMQFEANEPVTRLTLYEAFMRDWFEKEALNLISSLGGAVISSNLKSSFLVFSTKLAFELYRSVQSEVTYLEEAEGKWDSVPIKQMKQASREWDDFFTRKDPATVQARRGCPLRKVGEIGEYRYSFVHQSFLEYFIAVRLWNSLMGDGERLEERLSIWGARILNQKPKLPVVVDFLSQMVEEDKTGKAIARSYQLIEASKGKTADTEENAPYRFGASNAMTVLNYANHSFALYARTHPKVFEGIAAPYANLMQGELSGIDFRGSDLSHAELISAILDHTNLRETNLDGVEFRQMPAIHVDGEVIALCTAPPSAGGGMMAGVIGWGIRDIQRWMSKGEGYEAMLPIKTNHEEWITSVSMSPDGEWIASGSIDSTVRLWRALDGRAGPVCRGHESSVASVALNGDWIVSGSWDCTVRLWRASDGSAGPVCRGHEDWVASVALNGDWIVSGSWDRTVRLWRASDGTAGPVCRGHVGKVWSVALNGDWIVSGSNDETVRLWRASDGTAGPVCRGHEDNVASVALNGDWIVSGSWDRTVRLWRASDGSAGPVCRGHEDWVASVALNGDWIVSGSWDRTVRLWRLSDGSAGPVCRGHESIVASVALNGDWIVSGSWDRTVRIWRASDGSAGPVCRGHEYQVMSVALNGDWIVSGSRDRTVRLWRLSDGSAGPVCRGHEDEVTSVALNGDWIVSGSRDETVRLWRLSDGSAGPVCRGHEDEVTSVALNGDWIVSGSEDRTVRLWRLSDGTAGPVCRGHEERVWRVALSPTGDLIASLSQGMNRTYLVHRVNDGRLMREEAEAPWVKAALDEGRETALLESGIRLRARRDGKMVYLVEEKPSDEKAIRLWTRGRDEVRLSAKGCGFFGSKGLRDNQKELLRQLGAIEEGNEESRSTTASSIPEGVAEHGHHQNQSCMLL